MVYSRAISDELLACLEAYIDHPQNKTRYHDPKSDAPAEARRWDTVQEFLDFVFDSAMAGPLATCKPAAVVQAEETQKAALEAVRSAKAALLARPR